jgi:hypothetical protein
MDRPANGLPEDLRDHARLMCDIIAVAFQTNKTRVASLIISRDLSAMYYPFLHVKEGHHSASHNNNSDGYERIARFHVEQHAYLATKLDTMKEGNGTVLDNTCLLFLSNMWIGRKEDNLRSAMRTPRHGVPFPCPRSSVSPFVPIDPTLGFSGTRDLDYNQIEYARSHRCLNLLQLPSRISR